MWVGKGDKIKQGERNPQVLFVLVEIKQKILLLLSVLCCLVHSRNMHGTLFADVEMGSVTA